jgi:hypothetical protein
MQNTSTKKFSTSMDLQGWPVEFNVLGSTIGDDKWIAAGRYVNDDGLNLNLTGTVNSYTLFASYDGTKSITVLVGMDANTTADVDGCSFVNKNDFLSAITFHNAAGFGID